MEILCVIPARGGSKGIPGKNLKKLHGKSLLAWTAETALAANFTRTVLSTDSEKRGYWRTLGKYKERWMLIRLFASISLRS